jgi:hypothetical protein
MYFSIFLELSSHVRLIFLLAALLGRMDNLVQLSSLLKDYKSYFTEQVRIALLCLTVSKRFC